MNSSRYYPDPKTFSCDRYCGLCCKKSIIFPTSQEIKKIKELGFTDFCEKEVSGPHKGEQKLKHKQNDDCIFLEKDKKGKYSCKIYEHRPKPCKDYPFIHVKMNDCRDYFR